MTLNELELPSTASLRAIAALRSPCLAQVRPARIGLGFESAGAKQKTLAELESALGGPGRLPLRCSLRVLLDVLTGLGVLHRSISFIHGEVQPEHLVLGEDGVGRLIPVVRPHWAQEAGRTPERLYYLAPEKLLGDAISARSDVFSVGVLLWEAVAGQRLLGATTADDIIATLLRGGLPRALAPEGEPWMLPLADIAERAISVDPEQRFASVAELKEELEKVCSPYLATAAELTDLFASPELHARSFAPDAVLPYSQRVTAPPANLDPVLLDAAAERLSRTSFHALALEDEPSAAPRSVPTPPAPAAALEQQRGPSLAPLVSARQGRVSATDGELARSRRSSTALWLVLVAAAALGVFAVRPWLVRRIASASGIPERPVASDPPVVSPAVAAQPAPLTPTAEPTVSTDLAAAAASRAAASAASADRAEPAPSASTVATLPTATPTRTAQPVVVHDASKSTVNPATPPATAPAPAVPKPRAAPGVETTRYGI